MEQDLISACEHAREEEIELRLAKERDIELQLQGENRKRLAREAEIEAQLLAGETECQLKERAIEVQLVSEEEVRHAVVEVASICGGGVRVGIQVAEAVIATRRWCRSAVALAAVAVALMMLRVFSSSLFPALFHSLSFVPLNRIRAAVHVAVVVGGGVGNAGVGQAPHFPRHSGTGNKCACM
jgi:hypothetical protein